MLPMSPRSATPNASQVARMRLPCSCNLNDPHDGTAMLVVFEHCCEVRRFTTEQIETALGRECSVADGGFARALRSLHQRGYLAFEHNSVANLFEILFIVGDQL